MPKPWVLCVCPVCGRYRATSTGKNQLYCSGVGDERHEGVVAEAVPVARVPSGDEITVNRADLATMLAAGPRMSLNRYTDRERLDAADRLRAALEDKEGK